MITEEKETIIKEFLIDKLEPEIIYVFGSYANDDEREDSDIDIAFLPGKELDKYQLFLMSQKLAEKINTEVDLVDLKQASTVFKIQIIQGKLIYNRDNYIKMNFELKTLREYAKLNEERKEILKKVWG